MKNENTMPRRGSQVQSQAPNLQHYIRRDPVTRINRLTLQCPSCLKGELQQTGMVMQNTQPPVVHHRCKCGYELGVQGQSFPGFEFLTDAAVELKLQQQENGDEEEQGMEGGPDGAGGGPIIKG